MTDELTIKRGVIPKLSELTVEAVVLLLYLVDRAYVQRELGVGLSAAEVCRAIGTSSNKLRKALEELSGEGLVSVVAEEKYISITVSPSVATDLHSIPFKFDDTDKTKLKVLEDEVRRLRLQNERDRKGQKSGLTEIYTAEEGALYAEIEARGYGITPSEAVLLGKCLVKFGVERTRQTYRQMRTQKNPIMATYAALERGIKGQGAKQVDSEPFTKVHYPNLD